MLYEKVDGVNFKTIDLFHPVNLPEMEVAAIEVMRSGQIANGSKVSELEQAFAAFLGRENIVSTDDLTSALTLALSLAGVKAGDEVATMAFSCMQSNSPIALLGARPVWIDIDPTTMSMSLEDLTTKLKPSVKAVMLYHVGGYPADSIRIAALCRERGIPLIEDCNNAIGAVLDHHPIGFFGDYSVFSLYPNRQINGIDGGILVTPDSATAEQARRLRRYGINSITFRDVRGEINPKSDIPKIGWSAALNNLNSAVALSQFDTLSTRIEKTKLVASRLANALVDLSWIRLVKPVVGGEPAFWGFLILTEYRDALIEYLKARGIKSSILHHRNDCYTGFGSLSEDLPGTTLVMSQFLAIPCGWWLNDSQVEYVINQLYEFKA